jgi:lysine 2,3-aminomutase
VEIIEHLRGHTSGLAVPAYCIDGPGGAGKIPVGPEYVLSRSPEYLVLRNYEGTITAYREPPPYVTGVQPCETCGRRHEERPSQGVAAILEGKRASLEPAEMERRSRRRKSK